MSVNQEPRGPPQLIFDDGSRIMQDDDLAAVRNNNNNSNIDSIPVRSPRGNIPLHSYYEIDRISREVLDLCCSNQPRQDQDPSLPRIVRVALQFPDELLQDSPEVCWLLEDKLRDLIFLTERRDKKEPVQEEDTAATSSYVPFCFVLGDTTVNSCCPDEVAALHLNADVLVHYGHACLSPTGTLPMLYSFGKLDIDVPATVQQLEEARLRKPRMGDHKFLVLYQVGYHHAMEELKTKWEELHSATSDETGDLVVLVGEIPTPTYGKPQTKDSASMWKNYSCCQSGAAEVSPCSPSSLSRSANSHENLNDGSSSCCQRQAPIACGTKDEQDTCNMPKPRPLVVGGLELPKIITSWEDLSEFTVIFIIENVDDEDEKVSTSPQHRQYVNCMLCFLSLSNPPQGGYWIYSPSTKSLTTDVIPPSALHRQLKRRFFLTQKARDANVFGILVSNLSQQHLVQVVQSLQRIIQDADKSSYSFAVGKINPAKLANFAEIETFVIVACREHSLLDHEREYPVPVITPMELEIALGNLEWGAQAYSLDCQDVMIRQKDQKEETLDNDKSGDPNDREDSGEGDDDEDAPYFSLVTGKYVSKSNPTTAAASRDLDLKNLPGQGQVMEYKSEAANFLKQREYQGLESMVGQTEAKPAVQGLTGIASDYRGS